MRWATEIVSVWLQVRLVVLLLLHRVSFCCYYRRAAAVWCTISSRSAAPCRWWSLEVLCNWTTRGGRMGLPWNNSHLKWAIRRVFEKIFHIYWTWHRIAAVDQCLVVVPSMFENAFNSSTKVLQSVQSSGGLIHVELRSKCVVVNVIRYASSSWSFFSNSCSFSLSNLKFFLDVPVKINFFIWCVAL